MRVSYESALMMISLDIGSPQARRRLSLYATHHSKELFTGRGLERGDHTVATQAVKALALHPEQTGV